MSTRPPRYFVSVASKGLKLTVRTGLQRGREGLFAGGAIGSLGEQDARNCAPTEEMEKRRVGGVEGDQEVIGRSSDGLLWRVL